MKTERRHELHTNALAEWLADQIDILRPYARVAAGIVVALVVTLGLYSYLSGQSAKQSEQGWQRYFLAQDSLNQKADAEPLTQLAESAEFANTAVGYWAALSLSDHHLAEGINQLFNDRTAATKSLRSAVDGYARVANQSQFPMLAERATLGLGRTFESLNELDKARAAYQELANRASAGPFAAEAASRLQNLGQEPTKRFYDWFFAATPPRQSLGGPGTPGLRPNFGNVPDESSFKTPATDNDSLLSTPKPAESPATETPAGEAPSDGAAPAAESAPPAETPQP